MSGRIFNEGPFRKLLIIVLISGDLHLWEHAKPLNHDEMTICLKLNTFSNHRVCLFRVFLIMISVLLFILK